MLIVFLACLYISFLCWCWGEILLSALNHFSGSGDTRYAFSIVCLGGLSLITVMAGFLSLAMPLGAWWVQLIFIFPALAYFLLHGKSTVRKILNETIFGLRPLSFLLLVSCLLMILVMSSWTVVHPDTLSYHAQTIQWIEKFKAVPGLVHLHVRFGYQGQWFVDEALFSFSFLGVKGTTLLNSAVLLWFFVFVINRIDHYFSRRPDTVKGFLWILFLAACCWSYTQVRLTATSASPDFIAALFVFAVLYLLVAEKKDDPGAATWLMVTVLSVTALTIKLSAAWAFLFIIPSLFLFLKKKTLRPVLVVIFIMALTLFPFLTRNVITSGYPLFPSSLFSSSADWKYDPDLTAGEKNYIMAYAKKYGVETKDEVDRVNSRSPAVWLPGWWKQQQAADKVILLVFLVSVLISILFIRKYFREGPSIVWLALVLLSGTVFWFINAPDPRFGFGQILGFISLTAYIVFRNKNLYAPVQIRIAVLLILLISSLAYTGYRFKNFYNKGQWMEPAGIKAAQYTSITCGAMSINRPELGENFGLIPVPCTDLDCSRFEPRGDDISDGFRAAKTR